VSKTAPVSMALVCNTARYYWRQLRWVALIRATFRTAILRHGSELCQECGRDYLQWFAPAPLWTELVGGYGGLLCPRCFTGKARRAHIRVSWTPMVVARAGIPTSNHWGDPTRDRLLMGEPDPQYMRGDKVNDPQPPWGTIAEALGWEHESYYPAENRESTYSRRPPDAEPFPADLAMWQR